MSIAQETKIRELRAEVETLKARVDELQKQIEALRELTARPRVGRPPNDRNRTASGD